MTCWCCPAFCASLASLMSLLQHAARAFLCACAVYLHHSCCDLLELQQCLCATCLNSAAAMSRVNEGALQVSVHHRLHAQPDGVLRHYGCVRHGRPQFSQCPVQLLLRSVESVHWLLDWRQPDGRLVEVVVSTPFCCYGICIAVRRCVGCSFCTAHVHHITCWLTAQIMCDLHSVSHIPSYLSC